jgi:hypothetical protein
MMRDLHALQTKNERRNHALDQWVSLPILSLKLKVDAAETMATNHACYANPEIRDRRAHVQIRIPVVVADLFLKLTGRLQ